MKILLLFINLDGNEFILYDVRLPYDIAFNFANPKKTF